MYGILTPELDNFVHRSRLTLSTNSAATWK